MPFQIEVDVPEEDIGAWPEALRGAGPAWLESFGRHMIGRIRDTFDRLAYGGTYRGATWPCFRRKPPARRGGWSARLMDDTGRLKSSIGEIFRVDTKRLVIGTDVPYAAYQQRLRPFLFFNTAEDALSAARIAGEFIGKALKSNASAKDERTIRQ